jgi:hypothetical protein
MQEDLARLQYTWQPLLGGGKNETRKARKQEDTDGSEHFQGGTR